MQKAAAKAQQSLRGAFDAHMAGDLRFGDKTANMATRSTLCCCVQPQRRVSKTCDDHGMMPAVMFLVECSTMIILQLTLLKLL